MCTNFRLEADDGATVVGRTMEFGIEMYSQLVVIPRGVSMTGEAPEGVTPLAWTTKYGTVGINALGVPLTDDGMNTQGLYAGALYLPGFAEYMDPAKHPGLPGISIEFMLNYLLTSAASVEEAIELAKNVLVWGKVYEELGNIPAPLHLALHDSERSAVLEWVGGELHVHDNPLGVLTNSPPFDWHMINLRNYVNLHVTDVGEATFAGVRLPQMGQGSGLIGLPGDWTPPSRFVRAAVISHLAEVGADADAAVRTAIHVLNNFDIPVGVSRSADGIAAHDDYTQWSSIADLSRRSYFIRFAVDSGFHEIPLDSLGLESGEMRLLAARTPQDAVIPVLEM